MRSIFSIVLAFALSGSLAMAAAPSAKKASSDACVRWLVSQNGQSMTRAQQIRWSAIEENLLSLGYPQRIVDEKIKEIRARGGAFESQHEEILTMNTDWQPGKPITREHIEQLASDHFSREEIALALPYWMTLDGFDAAYFARQFIGETSWSPTDDGDAEKTLLFTSSLWLKGKDGFEAAKAILSGDQLVPYSWLRNNVDSQFHSALDRVVQQKLLAMAQHIDDYERTNLLLQVATYVPRQLIPVSVRRLIDEYVDLKAYPPIVMNSIGACMRGYFDAGDCEYMTNGHMITLGVFHDAQKDEDWRNTILLRVSGHIVGAVKRTGDTSMIALRNVVAKDGELILALGGVYKLPKDLIEEVRETSTNKSRWTGLDLTQLRVHPSTFLLNANAFEDLNYSGLMRVAAENLDKQEIIDILEEKIGASYGDTPRFDKQAWPAILKRLNNLRVNLEANRETK